MILQGLSEDERVRKIRAAVSGDGAELGAADERKLLLHVWEKLERTEDALRRELAEVYSLHITSPKYQQMFQFCS